MAADPAHVIQVEDLAGLGVELERGGLQMLDCTFDRLAKGGGRRGWHAMEADQRALRQVPGAVKDF